MAQRLPDSFDQPIRVRGFLEDARKILGIEIARVQPAHDDDRDVAGGRFGKQFPVDIPSATGVDGNPGIFNAAL